MATKDAPLTLDKLRLGQQAVIEDIEGTGSIVQRLFEMGLTEGEPVEIVAVAPLGDPIDIRIRSFQLSLRRSEAARVVVRMDS